MGLFHMGTRQNMDIPGIKYEYIDEVNKFIKNYIEEVDVEMCGVDMEVGDYGYPTIGARNIMRLYRQRALYQRQCQHL